MAPAERSRFTIRTSGNRVFGLNRGAHAAKPRFLAKKGISLGVQGLFGGSIFDPDPSQGLNYVGNGAQN